MGDGGTVSAVATAVATVATAVAVVGQCFLLDSSSICAGITATGKKATCPGLERFFWVVSVATAAVHAALTEAMMIWI